MPIPSEWKLTEDDIVTLHFDLGYVADAAALKAARAALEWAGRVCGDIAKQHGGHGAIEATPADTCVMEILKKICELNEEGCNV